MRLFAKVSSTAARNSPSNFAEAARRLESVSILPEARTFAERAVSLSPDGETLAIYAQVMVRSHQAEAAFQKIGIAVEGRPALQKLGQGVRTYYTPEEKGAFAAFLEKAKARAPKRISSRGSYRLQKQRTYSISKLACVTKWLRQSPRTRNRIHTFPVSRNSSNGA